MKTDVNNESRGVITTSAISGIRYELSKLFCRGYGEMQKPVEEK
ncbi:hypothetical protein [Mucilaginibacter sp.]|nr:hypothetical protein [Mucilaginibacter sp.]